MRPDDGIPVRFFGETAYLPAGPAAIALKSGAAMVTGALLRVPGTLRFTGAWEQIHYRHLITGDKEADIEAITQEIAYALERTISRHPDQWYMFRPMWPRIETSRRAAKLEAAQRALLQDQLEPGVLGEDGRRLRRLVARMGRRTRGGRIDVAALGISVDPPEMESWARGDYERPAQDQSPDDDIAGDLPRTGHEQTRPGQNGAGNGAYTDTTPGAHKAAK
jgi:hypothetical protein